MSPQPIPPSFPAVSASGACPLCGGTELVPWCGEVYRFGRRYEAELCRPCDLGVTVPPLDVATRERLHAATEYRPHGARFVGPVEQLRRWFAASRLGRLERHAPPGRLLDVGCGGGAFLLAARARGWGVQGAELTEATARCAREVGNLDVRTGEPSSWAIEEESLDAVTLWHVLEHVANPVALLEACGRLLRPGGVAVVAVPNRRSLQAEVAGRHWFHLDLPYHAVHFSPRSLGLALRRGGFETLSVTHGCLEQGPFGALQSLLNLAGIAENALFERLKSGGGVSGAWGALLSIALLPLLAPPAAALAAAESLLGRGAVITVCARRKRA